MIFLFLFLVLAMNTVLAIFAAQMAGRRNLSSGSWFLLTFFFGIIPILVLANMPKAAGRIEEVVSGAATMAGNRLTTVSGSRSNGESAQDAIVERWNVLKQVDEEVSAAAATIRLIDPQLEKSLAEKFFLLNDKTYLPKLVSAVVSEHEEKEHAFIAAKEKAARDRAKYISTLDATAREEISAYESTLLDGGIDPFTRKRVVSVDQYFGSREEFLGGIVVIQEGGDVLLKRGARAKRFTVHDKSWQ